ncbi:metallophosphoesterase family protein [Sulfuriferula sp. GW1]|uniref:metallophosphoesterase family protein n=1 Tax=Sulfuriferula sp. GW1 TaxID=3345111 RepID=UPI0039AF400D
MTVLLQISDTHFGTEQAPVVEALVRLAHEQAPDLVVLSGDITQRARRKQFRAARAFVDRLGVAVTLAIPGNHDIPLFDMAARLFYPYANYSTEFGTDLEPVFESDQLLVIALNTTRFYRHTDGEVSTEQIERVAQRLEQAAPSQLRIVVTHQPVAVTRAQDETNLLHGRLEAIPRWAQAGADIILGGHIHLPYVLALHERFADLARKVWAIQAGTAVSSRVRHEVGNSVNLIRYNKQGDQHRSAVIERWDYLTTEKKFRAVEIKNLDIDSSTNSA